ncbi:MULTISPECIES: TetR/AcrR family transcriptional regulator [unclassified Microbacterium]|uniref:TetR/AcrR family transcriptional regulator n=1 Tax=unclassified Microbacterium TaxID=2609290 RepID=UPI003746817E
MTSSTLRQPRRDAQENRAGILAAAADEIARDPHASLDAIARAAGLSRRALYGHFDDREALVRQVLVTGAARFNAIADRIDDDDPQRALARLAAELWHEASHVRVAAAIALDESHVADTAAALAPLRTRIAEIVRRGQDTGALRTDIAAPVLAHLIEETGRAVVARMHVDPAASAEHAVKAVLGIAGLSWRESVALLDAFEGATS